MDKTKAVVHPKKPFFDESTIETDEWRESRDVIKCNKKPCPVGTGF